jgi:hypothetical protein
MTAAAFWPSPFEARASQPSICRLRLLWRGHLRVTANKYQAGSGLPLVSGNNGAAQKPST